MNGTKSRRGEWLASFIDSRAICAKNSGSKSRILRKVMPARLTKGKRVESVNDAVKKVGNIVDGLGKGVWIVAWDDVPENETRARGSIKLVSQTAALSPATKLAVRAKDGAEDGDDGSDVDEDDGSSSSDESDDEEAKREELNPHNLKRKLWAEKSRALLTKRFR